MKRILKIISTTSILLFGILWIADKFAFLEDYNSIDLRNVLVLVYLVSSLKYFQLVVKDKNEEIGSLKMKLKKPYLMNL